MTKLNLEQLRKQAKDRVRAHRSGGEPITLSIAQFELAREARVRKLAQAEGVRGTARR